MKRCATLAVGARFQSLHPFPIVWGIFGILLATACSSVEDHPPELGDCSDCRGGPAAPGASQVADSSASGSSEAGAPGSAEAGASFEGGALDTGINGAAAGDAGPSGTAGAQGPEAGADFIDPFDVDGGFGSVADF